MLRFPGNVVGLFDCGTAMPDRDELEAIGSEGSLFLDDPWHCVVPGIELRRDGRVERIELARVDSYRRDDAVGQARTLEALHDSAWTGRSVAL